MTECLVCYETAPEGLTSMCTQCNNAFLCASCVASWRQSCLSRNKAVTCPKCRAMLELPPRALSPRAQIQSILMPVLVDMQERLVWLTPRRIVVIGAAVFLYMVPFVFFLFCLTRIRRQVLSRILTILLYVTFAGFMGFTAILLHGLLGRALQV